MTDELWRHNAVDLAHLIASKQVSSREVVEAHLARIDEVNPSVNAVVRVLAESALSSADAADAAVARGDALGSLHGVPITVKENIDCVGSPTTNGVHAFADASPSQDSPVVERMRGAGAIPIGRTNLPDFGLRIHTDSDLHGRTINPWDPERTAGGSSGGEGVALATGMSPLGLGNDLGGSLRNPAHCCGIASIKPSAGVVADAVEFPVEDSLLSFQVMAVQGVMARRVADVRAGFHVVARPHVRDPLSAPVQLTDLQPGERLRIAVTPTPPGGSTHPDVASAVRRAADALSDAGHEVVDATPPDVEQAIDQWIRMLNVDLRVQKPLLDELMGAGGKAFLDHVTEVFDEVDLAAWAMLQAERHGLARRWSRWFVDHQAVIWPIWTQPAFAHDADIADQAGALATVELMRTVLPANLLGLPAVAVPAGISGTVPVGVQVMGARFTDLRCLAIAEQIEEGLGSATPIDPRT
jgi:amidase